MAAIELLERAERETSAQWISDAPEERLIGAALEHSESLLGGERFEPGAAEIDPAAIAKALHAEELREIFSHFQTLKGSEPISARMICLTNADSPATEAFHLLGVRLRSFQREHEIKNLLITSSVPQEGKSVVAANLACTLGSGARQKVLLIGGDIRRPSLSQLFGIAQVPGLCDYLQGKRSLCGCLHHLVDAGIWILPTGDNPGDSLELIQSPQLPELMATLKSWFDWIVIDSPPALPMADTSVWSRLADGILLVARRGTTRKRALQRSLEALDSTKLLGALMNASTNEIDNDYYYYRRSPEASGQTNAEGR
jgi:capsular exopolysaccharide synthesis family protein